MNIANFNAHRSLRWNSFYIAFYLAVAALLLLFFLHQVNARSKDHERFAKNATEYPAAYVDRMVRVNEGLFMMMRLLIVLSLAMVAAGITFLFEHRRLLKRIAERPHETGEEVRPQAGPSLGP